MNPLLSILGGGNGFAGIMMKAVGAAMRGESPEAFIRNLAATEPRLQGLDLNNLEATANSLAQKNGIDINAAIPKLQDEVRKFM